MDRLDAMKVLVAAVDEGSLAAAGRRLARSPAAVSRAIAFLEEQAGSKLLYRTTRSIKLSEEGERYVASCRRVLSELEEADVILSGGRSVPRGVLSLTAGVYYGEMILLPIVEEFLDACPMVSVRLMLFDRQANLLDEGIDLALRVGQLADSSMVATRIGVARRVVVATPSYLKSHTPITEPSDLAKHQIISMEHIANSWSFSPASGSPPRTVQFAPRLLCNSMRAVLASALAGRGVARVLSYLVAEHVQRGELEIVLAGYEPEPRPVHLLCPQGRLSVPRVRAFVDFALPRLKNHRALIVED
jgi:DNA-binding transcriptional LysR family regulator